MEDISFKDRRKNKETLSKAGPHVENVSIALKFIFNGYKPEYYYWEIILIIKKVLLIFIGNFTEFFPTDSKATILLIVLAIFIFIQSRYKPYEAKVLNQIEFLSLFVTFLSANIGIMLFSEDMKKIGEYLLICLIV